MFKIIHKLAHCVQKVADPWFSVCILAVVFYFVMEKVTSLGVPVKIIPLMTEKKINYLILFLQIYRQILKIVSNTISILTQ